MEGILQAFIHPISAVRERTTPKLKENDDLVEEIAAVKTQLRNVQNRFNLYTDFDMTDSCIYEMEALEARYRHLIKRAKEEKRSGLR